MSPTPARLLIYPSWSETATLRSSITAYRMENGRRYHAYKDGAYWSENLNNFSWF